MSNAEDMALLKEFVEAKRESLFRFAEFKKVDDPEKAVKDIEDNLEILAQGGQLSGGL